MASGKELDRILGERLAEGELSALEEDLPTTAYAFPGDLETLDHWVAFSVANYKYGRKEDFSRKEILETVFLPVPMNLGTSYSAGYSSEAIGVFGVAGAGIGQDLGIGDMQQAGHRIVDRVKMLTGDKNSTELTGGLMNLIAQGAEAHVGAILATSIGGPAGGIAALAAEQGLKGALYGAGIARNPHMAVLFSGVDFRSHTFEYKFMPKTEAESYMLTQIIRLFKYRMLPGYAGGTNHFFDYPQQFDIDFHYPKHLFNIAPSVLTGFEVNYHGEGQPAYFDNGDDEKAPVSITLSMTFQEVTITTKEEIEKQNR